MSILTDYKIQLINRNNIGKQIISVNGILTGCINDHYYIQLVDYLLNEINDAITINGLEVGIPTQSSYLIIATASQTKLYKNADEWDNDNNITPDYVLPTQHFKIIVEAWRNFLQG
ncbi:hypothetical protein [Flavobacterium sp.]|uniref:hypothetical protein n=1 Tax=Flavobacterium sp. TaxID=239 RepID=UPI003753AE8C